MSRIALLLGAGASVEAGVPLMPTLGRGFLESFATSPLREDLERLSARASAQSPHEWGERGNIETLLEYLGETAGGDPEPLTRRAAAIIRFEALKYVLQRTSQHRDDLTYLDGLRRFIAPDGGCDVFSLNYDTVIEDWCGENSIKYTDGFEQEGHWAPERLRCSDYSVRLSKLHGSVTWAVRSGIVRRGAPAGDWRTEISWGRLASLTFDASVIYPATRKGPTGFLRVLSDHFGLHLNTLNVLIIAGYRCVDEHIVTLLREGLATNGNLEIVICNPNADEVLGHLLSRPDLRPFRRRLHAHGEGFGAALRGGLAEQVEKLRRTGRVRKNSVLTLDGLVGDFRAVTRSEGGFVLGVGPYGLAKFDRRAGMLRQVCNGFGDLRGVAIREDDAFVVDCRLHKYLGGLGGIWRVNVQSGRRQLLGGGRTVAVLRGLVSQIREQELDPLALGLIRWPTGICTSADPNVLYVVAARQIIQVTLRPFALRALTEPLFFNAIAMAHTGGGKVVVAEHVFSSSELERGLGVLWLVDTATGGRRPLKAGVKLGHGLEYIPGRRTVVGTRLVSSRTWELVEISIDDGRVIRSNGSFQGKAVFAMVDDTAVVVKDERLYDGFRQPFLRLVEL